jgi:hypothetical protein
MRIVALACLLVFGLISFAQETQENEKERLQLKKAKVSSETIMGFGVDEFGKALEQGTKKSTRLFDENGNMTSLIEYNTNSQPTKRLLLKYNTENQLIAGAEYLGFDQLMDKYTINYKNGLKVRKVSTLDSNRYEIQYKYDKNGAILEKSKYKEINEKEYSYKYEYAGKLLAKETYWSEKMTLVKSFQYDSLNRLITEKNSSDKYQGYTFTFAYDSLGNKAKETQWSTENIPYEWFEYVYDEKKQITSVKKYNYLGNLTYTWRYFYDKNNNVEFVKIYESNAQRLVYITQYVYRYFGPNGTTIK